MLCNCVDYHAAEKETNSIKMNTSWFDSDVIERELALLIKDAYHFIHDVGGGIGDYPDHVVIFMMSLLTPLVVIK